MEEGTYSNFAVHCIIQPLSVIRSSMKIIAIKLSSTNRMFQGRQPVYIIYVANFVPKTFLKHQRADANGVPLKMLSKEICRRQHRLERGFVVGISTAGLISRFNECRGTYAVNAAHYLCNSRNDNKDESQATGYKALTNVTTMLIASHCCRYEFAFTKAQ